MVLHKTVPSKMRVTCDLLPSNSISKWNTSNVNMCLWLRKESCGFILVESLLGHVVGSMLGDPLQGTEVTSYISEQSPYECQQQKTEVFSFSFARNWVLPTKMTWVSGENMLPGHATQLTHSSFQIHTNCSNNCVYLQFQISGNF